MPPQSAPPHNTFDPPSIPRRPGRVRGAAAGGQGGRRLVRGPHRCPRTQSPRSRPRPRMAKYNHLKCKVLRQYHQPNPKQTEMPKTQNHRTTASYNAARIIMSERVLCDAGMPTQYMPNHSLGNPLCGCRGHLHPPSLRGGSNSSPAASWKPALSYVPQPWGSHPLH